MPDQIPWERTLVLVKPDAVQRRLVGEILTRFERRGLRIVAMRMLQIDRALAERHYAVHKGKPFYESLLVFITSAPVVAIVLEAPGAIRAVRRVMGATNPAEAEPGTIRADLAVQTSCNLVHGSDSPETARYEIELFFRPEEIVSVPSPTDPFVFGL
jgi:nucleoside-diphosphate kinase